MPWFVSKYIQIVRIGKLSRLQHLVEICGKTFTAMSFVQYLLTSFMKIHWKTFAVAS